jgi:hypothetical protein
MMSFLSLRFGMRGMGCILMDLGIPCTNLFMAKWAGGLFQHSVFGIWYLVFGGGWGGGVVQEHICGNKSRA